MAKYQKRVRVTEMCGVNRGDICTGICRKDHRVYDRESVKITEDHKGRKLRKPRYQTIPKLCPALYEVEAQ